MWKRMHKMWRSKLEAKGWSTQSMVFYPYAYTAIEATTMKLVGMGAFPPLHVRGRHPEYDELAPAAEAYLHWVWRQNKMRWRLLHFLKAGEIYGTSFAMPIWRTETKIVKRWMPTMSYNAFTGTDEPNIDAVTGQPIKGLVDVPYTITDNPVFEYIHPGDVWVPEGYSGFEEDAVDGRHFPYVITRHFSTLGELKKQQENGVQWKNLDKINTHFDYTSMPREDSYSVHDIATEMGITGQHEQYYEDEGIVPLYYMWGPEDVKVFGGLDVVVLEDENPFAPRLPVLAYRSITSPGQFYGLPEILFSEALQDALNAFGNLILEHLHMSVNPVMIGDQKAFANQMDRKWRAGDFIPINVRSQMAAKDAISFAQPPPLSNDTYFFLNHLIGLFEEVTSTSKANKGVAGGAKLATEAAIAADAHTAKFNQKIFGLEECVFVPLFKQWIELGNRFMDEEKMYHALG
jgi:hypothetical protein